MLEKWKKAVIHLECTNDKINVFDRNEEYWKLFDKFDNGDITSEEFQKESLLINKVDYDIHRGTGLFLSNNSKRYLLTAKHVVWDQLGKIEYESLISSFPEGTSLEWLESTVRYYENRLYCHILRVPSLNEINKRKTPPIILVRSGGPDDTSAYTFSSDEIDLAIISLDRYDDSRFADELVEVGYEPISLEDINNHPSNEGTDVFTVGYPGPITSIGNQNFKHKLISNIYSLPTFVFGKVSMLHEILPYFWVDMSIYPGNSGGPIIENDKLVGIISQQPIIPTQSHEFVKVGIPFGKITKSKYVFDLIKKQEEKDNLEQEMYNPSP